MHMLSYQTTLLLYMVSTTCTLINLIYVIPLYLKFGLRLRTKTFAVSYIPGKENYDADPESRKKQTKLEWMLNHKIFKKLFLSLNFNQR